METPGIGNDGLRELGDGNGQSAAAGSSASVTPEWLALLVQGLQAVVQRSSASSVPKVGGAKDFQSLHPPKFDGSGGPLVAKDWIE